MFMMHNELVRYLSDKGFDPRSGNSEVPLLTASLLWPKAHISVILMGLNHRATAEALMCPA